MAEASALMASRCPHNCTMTRLRKRAGKRIKIAHGLRSHAPQSHPFIRPVSMLFLSPPREGPRTAEGRLASPSTSIYSRNSRRRYQEDPRQGALLIDAHLLKLTTTCTLYSCFLYSCFLYSAGHEAGRREDERGRAGVEAGERGAPAGGHV